MSYSQTYQGRVVYADAHCLEAGLDAFLEAIAETGKHDEESCVDLDDVELDGLAISIDWRGSAPASMSFGTQSAQRGLASTAKSGGFDTSFELDGTSYEGIGCGKRRSSKGLPPRHHRWDIYFAARAGDVKALEALAADGVSLGVTYAHFGNRSALHVAAANGALASVQTLLAAGIAADITDDDGDTPLASATTAEVARALLAAGAVVEGKAKRAPLEYAFQADLKDVVEVLLDAGAKPPASSHADVVDTCASNGWIDILHRLVELDGSITKVFAKPDVMKSAIRGADPVLVDLLLEHGAKLPKDFLEQTIRAGAVALAEGALRAPGALDKGGYEAVATAANNGDVPMLELLVKHGAPLVAKGGKSTALHAVAGWEADTLAATVRWLLDHGVPLEATDEDGDTALINAVRSYSNEKALILLELGADPSRIDELEAETVAYVAKKGGARWTKALANARKSRPIAAKTATRSTKKAATKKAATKKPATKKSSTKKSSTKKSSTKKSSTKKSASRKR